MGSLSKFLDYLKHEKRYSKHTIKSYTNDINQFKSFLELNYELTDEKLVKHTHIRSWMVQLMEENISPRSINRKLSTLRSYFNYLRKLSLIDNNPLLKIISPKVGKRLPEYVKEDQLEQLFDTIDIGDFEDYRNRLIVELIYVTGMRRTELINLKDSDIQKSVGAIKVLGKGNKERIIPLAPQIFDKFERYKDLRSAYFEDLSAFPSFFVTNKGKILYPKFVYNVVKKYLSSVTTMKKRSPHILRHSFATHLMNQGADLNAVKELLGHANLAATQVYTHNSIEKLREVYRKAHPKSQ